MAPTIDPRKRERFIELMALGLYTGEAARAAEISERTGERLMSKPETREAIAQKKPKQTMLGDMADTVQDMLDATRADGTPDLAMRAKGAELLGRHYELLQAEDDDLKSALPEGVYRVYPLMQEPTT
jgi:hypothetical protein